VDQGLEENKGKAMARTALSRMLDEVKRLTPNEQKQLREAIDSLLAFPSTSRTEEEFERELVEAGILTEVPPLPAEVRPIPDRKPIDVKGKPLSETIIEERR
jgi:hypothetical protein